MRNVLKLNMCWKNHIAFLSYGRPKGRTWFRYASLYLTRTTGIRVKNLNANEASYKPKKRTYIRTIFFLRGYFTEPFVTGLESPLLLLFAILGHNLQKYLNDISDERDCPITTRILPWLPKTNIVASYCQKINVCVYAFKIMSKKIRFVAFLSISI